MRVDGKRSGWIFGLCIAILGGMWAWAETRAVNAQAKVAAKAPADLQIVAYASGLTGFFDSKTRRLYLYDANLDQPFIVREIEELGKPLKKIQN